MRRGEKAPAITDQEQGGSTAGEAAQQGARQLRNIEWAGVGRPGAGLGDLHRTP